MTEYRVEWCQRPPAQRNRKVLFVEAATRDNAEAVAINHIERNMGIARAAFAILDVTEAKPVPFGKVVGKPG